ncbi:MAG TPA: M20/M25/M40 family metallo-hydrolase, partial [Thermomicrobiales bacterium]|nr:M20/M25/M40 family metallo-hydrolase [Thermomicrobiales bacterium]
MSDATNLNDVYAHIDAHAEEYIAALQRLLRQPSIAAQGVGMAETAAIVEEMLTGLGATPRQVDTRGGFPVVYAELPGQADRWLSFYNHYDVQPADPLDEWESDPWAGEIRDGRIWARGVADNKGNIAARVAAIDAWQKVRGPLPLNVKFIIEGEEEIGSPHLQNFAEDHPDLCRADACIWEFGGRDIDGRPQIHLGLKGICYVELRAKGARTDWHSASATSVPNPAWRLVWALSTLKGQDDKILIPGFYDKVIAPTQAELEALANLPDTEQERLADLGIDRFINGLTGRELHLKDYFQPTCTI